MKRWLFGSRVYLSVARGPLGWSRSRLWYTRTRHKTRHYHLLAITHVVLRKGSFYKLIVGPIALCFLRRDRKGDTE